MKKGLTLYPGILSNTKLIVSGHQCNSYLLPSVYVGMALKYILLKLFHVDPMTSFELRHVNCINSTLLRSNTNTERSNVSL